MGLLIQAPIVLAAALAFSGAWYVLQKNVLTGAALVLVTFVARVIAISYAPLEYAGINIYPEDLVFFLLATVGAPRLFSQRRRSWTQFASAGFALLVIVGFILGVAENNLKLSGVECRPYFYFSACALYFLTFSVSPANIGKLTWLLNVAALFLVAVAGYRWMAQLLNYLPVPPSWANTAQLTTFRVLTANEALFLWQAFLFNLYLRATSPAARIRFYLCLTLPPLVILLQHRSVWAVVLISGAIVMVRERVLSRRFMLIGLSLIVAAGLVLSIPGDFSDSIRSSLDHSFREPLDPVDSTFSWRVEGWRQLLTGGYLGTPAEIVFGRHFGRGLLRYYHGEAINLSAHNAYIDTLMQLGIVGLCLLLCCYLGSLARLRRLRVSGLVPTRFVALLRVILVTNLVYFMVYGVSYEQGIILGTAIGMGAYRERRALLSEIHYTLAPITTLRPRVGAGPLSSQQGDLGA